MNVQNDVLELVQNEALKLNIKNKETKMMYLIERCQNIIYNEWGYSNQKTWDLIDEYSKNIVYGEI